MEIPGSVTPGVLRAHTGATTIEEWTPAITSGVTVTLTPDSFGPPDGPAATLDWLGSPGELINSAGQDWAAISGVPLGLI